MDLKEYHTNDYEEETSKILPFKITEYFANCV